LVNLEGEVRIADFGHSRTLLTNKRFTVSNRVGSSWWLAPEICASEKYDTKCDIWSYGIVCIELAMGDPPNLGKMTPDEAMIRTKNDKPPHIDKSKWSDKYKNFVKRCLTKDQYKRPTASDLLQDDFMKDADSHKAKYFKSLNAFYSAQNSDDVFN
jgi:serine/threonine protein kinase